MLDRMRRRLTLGYAGVFALIILFLAAAAVAGFSRELTIQQDTLLAQEAEDQTANLLEGEDREVLASGSSEYSWVAFDPEGRRVTDRDPTAASLGTLGLPDRDLAARALDEGAAVPETIRGPEGRVRVLSVPMRDGAETVGVMQYARSQRGVQETVNRLLLVLLPLALGGVGAALLGGLYMSGRAVRPARESFERQRAFVADASHELKTPLTLIRADAEMVLYRGNLNAEDGALVEHALSETDRMGAILSDLLLVARLDAGKLEVADKPFDLAVVLAEEAGRFGPRAAAKEVRLDVRAPAGLPARGDAKRTAQILAVLLDNAVRFTPPGGAITVEGRSREHRAEASVTDSGPGIAPEHLPRVFDRFYRADAARKRGGAGGGTGLGLAIARELAEAQRGGLTAEDAVAEGAPGAAVLRLWLPRA